LAPSRLQSYGADLLQCAAGAGDDEQAE
jgi:hypothetical protein